MKAGPGGPARSPWRRAVLALDAWLRARLGIVEYTTHPDACLRIALRRAEAAQALADGTGIAVGEPAIELHLWNERLPMRAGGPDLGWALALERRLRISFVLLAAHLESDPALAGVKALYAEAALARRGDARRVERIAARFGFAPEPGAVRRGSAAAVLLANTHSWLLDCVLNPRPGRPLPWQRVRQRLWISRAEFVRRYRLPPGRCPGGRGG